MKPTENFLSIIIIREAFLEKKEINNIKNEGAL